MNHRACLKFRLNTLIHKLDPTLQIIDGGERHVAIVVQLAQNAAFQLRSAPRLVRKSNSTGLGFAMEEPPYPMSSEQQTRLNPLEAG